MITYGSVCSGIEAASVGWKDLDWKPLWFAEIDKFSSKVLAHHYPDVPNLGDMLTIADRLDEVGVPDVLVGGTPCQTFSLSGGRGSISDERGSLSLSFTEIYREIKRRKPHAIALWENVPGVLHTNDNAFGYFLAGLVGANSPITPRERWGNQGVVDYGENGGVAWRVLDAQYFGVAQRRRRVFVVASSSGRRSAEILLERTSESGNH